MSPLSYRDPTTGAKVLQWTNGEANSQHLYFTSPSVTQDDRWLVFLSDRSGHPNLHVIDRCDGTSRQLSRNTSGLLRSYVYPQGKVRGLSKASPCLDPVRNRVFYLRDDAIYFCDLDQVGGERRLCEIPAGWVTAFTHVSPDGTTLCVPCTDPRAFVDEVPTQWDQMRRVPDRMAREGLLTRLLLIDMATGQTHVAAEIPFWVTHVQFDPAGTGRILFNRDGFQDNRDRPVHQRIWCLEPDGTFRPLAPEPPGEWRSHENWALDGQSIVYHGARDGQAFLAARTWEGELLSEVSLEGIEFWHATAALDGRSLFVDRPDGLISLVDPVNRRVVDICRHDSIVESQDAHPHPITTFSGRSILFTSIRTGRCQVYEAFLPEG